MKARVEVTYKLDDINSELDGKIRDALESIGAEWYAQGYDLVNRVRDIAFDLEVPLLEEMTF